MTSTTRLRGLVAASAALTLVVGISASAHAAPFSGPARRIALVPTTDPACATTKPLTLFNINDWHGRIRTAAQTFTPVEQLRATQPDVILASAGDNVGATIFESFINNDNPAIDILNAANLQVSAPGNHEFDKGYADFRDHIEPRADFDYVAANMTGTDMAPYKVITTASGIRVAYIGANTTDLPSLVSPSGIAGITVTDPVAAINATADKLTAKGEADIVVAEVHDQITSGYNDNVDVVFNGHTHGTYTLTNNHTPVVQANEYGNKLARVDLRIGTGNVICGAPHARIVTPPAAADTTLPRIAAIKQIAETAKTKADIIGAQTIGKACSPITRGSKPGDPTSKPGDNRSVESTMTDMVADAFFTIGGGNPDTTIGMQNPGGTRADLMSGAITYAQAAAVLPFANTIMTTQITGSQLKTVLEQQWQRNADGTVPSRAYLQLGLSNNVTYTYDATRPEGSRITSIYVNGKPVTPWQYYTIVSGSFLISGGDNFRELANGINKTDTGMSDLEAFVNWIKVTKKGSLCPTYERQAVSLQSMPTSPVACGTTATFKIGVPSAAAPDTMNLSNNAPLDPWVDVYLGGRRLNRVTIVNGQATVSVKAPSSMPQNAQLSLKTANGTTTILPVTLSSCIGGSTTVPAPAPGGWPTAAPPR